MAQVSAEKYWASILWKGTFNLFQAQNSCTPNHKTPWKTSTLAGLCMGGNIINISGRFERWQQMLALHPEQGPLTDKDLHSSSYKLGSASEVLQDFFLWEPYYKWHSTRLLLDLITSSDSSRLAEEFLHPTPPPHPPNVYNICFHLHLLLDTGFVHPFSKHKSFICCRFPFTKLFSLFSGKVEGWLSLWKSGYPIRTDSYPGALHVSVSMLFVFCFTCMIYAINCTASLLYCKDFY